MRIRSRPPKILNMVKKDIFFIFGTCWTAFTWFLSIFIIKDKFSMNDIFNEEFLIAIVFCILFSAVGLIMIYFPLSRAILIRHLHQKGLPIKATVTKITVTVETNELPSHTSIEYNFNYNGNDEYKGKTGLVPIENSNRLKIGDKINILYDPKNPNKTAWIEGCI